MECNPPKDVLQLMYDDVCTPFPSLEFYPKLGFSMQDFNETHFTFQ